MNILNRNSILLQSRSVVVAVIMLLLPLPASGELIILDSSMISRRYFPKYGFEVPPVIETPSSPIGADSLNLNRSVEDLAEYAKTLDEPLEIVGHNFSVFGADENENYVIITSENDEMDDNVPVHLAGQILCYPNPFRLSEGTEVGYRLSKSADVQIHIYNMLGHRIFSSDYAAGSVGAKGEYNRLVMNLDTYDDFFLSSGVYILVLISEGQILGRTKMAVIP